jgi:hypothetical protein
MSLLPGELSTVYRPRPASNDLKLIIEDSLEELYQVWDSRFRDLYGPLHLRIRDLCERFIRCGDPHFGFVRLRCVNPDCPKRDEREPCPQDIAGEAPVPNPPLTLLPSQLPPPPGSSSSQEDTNEDDRKSDFLCRRKRGWGVLISQVWHENPELCRCCRQSSQFGRVEMWCGGLGRAWRIIARRQSRSRPRLNLSMNFGPSQPGSLSNWCRRRGWRVMR